MASNAGKTSEDPRELRELRELVRGADGIEPKLTRPERSYRSAAAADGSAVGAR